MSLRKVLLVLLLGAAQSIPLVAAAENTILFTSVGWSCDNLDGIAPPTDGWMALTKNSTESALRPVAVKLGSNPVVTNTIEIVPRMARSDRPVCVVRAPTILRSGPVESHQVFKKRRDRLANVVLAGGRRYSLRIRKALAAESDELGSNTVLEIRCGSDAQTISWVDETAGDAEGMWIEWAGDMDRDGKLDLITRSSSERGSSGELWLSSKAAPGQLLRCVGSWSASC